MPHGMDVFLHGIFIGHMQCPAVAAAHAQIQFAEIIPFVEQKTGRRPIILPILTEIDHKKM